MKENELYFFEYYFVEKSKIIDVNQMSWAKLGIIFGNFHTHIDVNWVFKFCYNIILLGVASLWSMLSVIIVGFKVCTYKGGRGKTGHEWENIRVAYLVSGIQGVP